MRESVPYTRDRHLVYGTLQHLIIQYTNVKLLLQTLHKRLVCQHTSPTVGVQAKKIVVLHNGPVLVTGCVLSAPPLPESVLVVEQPFCYNLFYVLLWSYVVCYIHLSDEWSREDRLEGILQHLKIC